MRFTKITLPSGLRLIVQPMAGTKTVTVLVTVATGSKYETRKENGLSHFLEHMMFKGTAKRPTALAISETLDAVGGEYNAFTGKEETSYYAKVAAGHFDLALDVLSDMLLNSKLAAEEIEREKGVIAEEINMYQDTPMRYASDLFEQLLYGDTPAGRDIAGTKASVRALTRADFIDYWQRQYTALNTVVTVAGACDVKRAQAAVVRAFQPLLKTRPKAKPRVKERQAKPGLLLKPKETDQMHLRLGVRTFPVTSALRPTLAVLSAVLGGGMSSRLFISVRERQGLAYYVYTENEFFTDHGYLSAQAGVRRDKLADAVKSIGAEFRRLRDQTVRVAELTKAKEYIKGKALLGLESSDQLANFLAHQEALTGHIQTMDEYLSSIDKVTGRGIKEAAAAIFRPEKLNLAVIGPVKNEQPLAAAVNKIFS